MTIREGGSLTSPSLQSRLSPLMQKGTLPLFCVLYHSQIRLTLSQVTGSGVFGSTDRHSTRIEMESARSLINHKPTSGASRHLLPKEGGERYTRNAPHSRPFLRRGRRAKRDGVGFPRLLKYVSPFRHRKRSRGIFLARPPYARMRPHLNDTLVLPLPPFPHSRVTALQEGSLHFGPHDTQERRIVSHPFSYRCVELCLSEALYPAPSARAVWPHRKAP